MFFVSENQSGYETERFENYKKLYNDRLASVKVAAVVRGEENAVLLSLITDAVNQMGLSVVGPEDSSALLSVEADAQVDGYGSERLKGLIWASTSAAVSLRDLQAGTTFARFNVYDRAGTGRKADSPAQKHGRRGKQGFGGNRQTPDGIFENKIIEEEQKNEKITVFAFNAFAGLARSRAGNGAGFHGNGFGRVCRRAAGPRRAQPHAVLAGLFAGG